MGSTGRRRASNGVQITGDHFRDAEAVSMRARKAHSQSMKAVLPYPAYSPKGAADGRFEE